MKTVRCRFKGVGKEQFEAFQESTCLLRISVGQNSHEDGRFEATMELIKNSFRHCTVALHDTLQRHTMAIAKQDETPVRLRDKALSLGDSWLDRNKHHCEKMAEELTVVRWDEWLSKAEYADWKNTILAQLESDEQYQKSFQHSIDEYLVRYARRLENPSLLDCDRAEQLCLDYLVEECAAMCMWPQTGCQFEIYAGTDNMAMMETRERFIRPTYPKLLELISIRFNHRPDMSPQKLDLVTGVG